MKAPELQKHFERFGSVENVELITDKTGADQRVFRTFSELQLWEDGVDHATAAPSTGPRESTRLVTVSCPHAGTRRTAKVRMGNPFEAMEALDGKHDVNGVVLTVDLYQKTRNDLVRDCSSGFERRLVAQRNGADLCYAVHA